MNKDFDNWNLFKKKLNKRNPKNLYFEEREIWYCSIGLNIGHEQDGKNEYFERPVIIFKKFNSSTFWGIPLTRRKKTGKKYFHWEFLKNKPSTAILHQIKLLDSKRLQRKVGNINDTLAQKISYKWSLLFSS